MHQVKSSIKQSAIAIVAGSETAGMSLLDLLPTEVFFRQSGNTELWMKSHDSSVSKSDGAASVPSTVPESIESAQSDGENDEGVEVTFFYEHYAEKAKREEDEARPKLRLNFQRVGRSFSSLRMLQKQRKGRKGEAKPTKLKEKATYVQSSVSKASHLIVHETKRTTDTGEERLKEQALPVRSPSFWNKLKTASKTHVLLSSKSSTDTRELPLNEENLNDGPVIFPKEAPVNVEGLMSSESSVAKNEDDDEAEADDLKLITSLLYDDKDTNNEQMGGNSSTEVAETTWCVDRIGVLNSCGCDDDGDDDNDIYTYKHEELDLSMESNDDEDDVFEGLLDDEEEEDDDYDDDDDRLLLRKVVSVSFDHGKVSDDDVSSMGSRLSESSDDTESSSEYSSSPTSYEEVTVSTFDDESLSSEYDDFKKAMILLRNRAAKQGVSDAILYEKIRSEQERRDSLL